MSETKLTLFQRLRCHPILYGTLQVLLVLGLFPAFFSWVSFQNVETHSQALVRGYELPEGWSGGVMNHGSYYEWYTVADAPWLFGLSVAYLVGVIGYLFWLGYLGMLGLDR